MRGGREATFRLTSVIANAKNDSSAEPWFPPWLALVLPLQVSSHFSETTPCLYGDLGGKEDQALASYKNTLIMETAASAIAKIAFRGLGAVL